MSIKEKTIDPKAEMFSIWANHIRSGNELSEDQLGCLRLLSAIFPKEFMPLRWEYEDRHPAKPAKQKKGGADK